MEENINQQKIIDLNKIVKLLWEKRMVYFKVLPVVFVLSCIWIFPQPRFYTCTVALAPESSSTSSLGGLASVASSFGINIGDMSGGSDAIYPILYPELFESPEFIVDLLNVNIETQDGVIKTDYYTYLSKHKKKNPLTAPFNRAKSWITNLFKKNKPKPSASPNEIDPFHMSYYDYMLVEGLKEKIKCSVDKKTDVISITVKDQDPLVCASMADSVMVKLQSFIIKYRTSKARQDVEYYTKLTNDAEKEYNASMAAYSKYCDSHTDAILQSVMSERDKLENELSIKLQTYTSLRTQMQMMAAKVQERTPAFTTLKSASVPVKPAGPKRMIFVIGMCFLAIFVTSFMILRRG